MFSRIRDYLDHKAVAPNLSAYIDGALAAHERERLERHLAVCAQCQRDLATLRQTVNLLRRVPLKRVPRSFALPASVQDERTAYRRWGLANSFMRASAAAVTFMLILFLSTDALLRFGAISIPDASLRREKYAAPRVLEAAPEIASTEAQPLEPTAEALVKEPPAAERAAVPEASPLAAGVGGGAAGTPEQEAAVEKAVPAPSEAPSGSAVSAAKIVAAPRASEGTPTAEAAPTAAAAVEASAEGSKGTMGAGRPQDVAPSPTATSTVVRPISAPTQAMMTTAEPQATFAAEPEAPLAPPAISPLWRLWRTVRLLSGLLAGLLCILFAGLIWTSRKRRV
jgi:anti-sigma factor RsiW